MRLLGIGSEDERYPKPILNQYLNNEFVIDISCGDSHSIVLTNCCEVYAWGWNRSGQIGMVVMIINGNQLKWRVLIMKKL